MKFINLGLALVLASCGSIGSYNNGDSAIESSAVGINYLSGHKSMVGQLSVEECGAYKSGYCFLVFGEKYYLPFDCAEYSSDVENKLFNRQTAIIMESDAGADKLQLHYVSFITYFLTSSDKQENPSTMVIYRMYNKKGEIHSFVKFPEGENLTWGILNYGTSFSNVYTISGEPGLAPCVVQ